MNIIFNYQLLVFQSALTFAIRGFVVAMSRVSQILESRDLFKDCMYMLHLHSKELLKTLLKGIVLLDG